MRQKLVSILLLALSTPFLFAGGCPSGAPNNSGSQASAPTGGSAHYGFETAENGANLFQALSAGLKGLGKELTEDELRKTIQAELDSRNPIIIPRLVSQSKEHAIVDYIHNVLCGADGSIRKDGLHGGSGPRVRAKGKLKDLDNKLAKGGGGWLFAIQASVKRIKDSASLSELEDLVQYIEDKNQTRPVAYANDFEVSRLTLSIIASTYGFTPVIISKLEAPAIDDLEIMADDKDIKPYIFLQEITEGDSITWKAIHYHVQAEGEACQEFHVFDADKLDAYPTQLHGLLTQIKAKQQGA